MESARADWCGVRNIFALTWHGATIIGFVVKPTGKSDANARNAMMRRSLSRIRSIIGSRVGIGASKTQRRYGLPGRYGKCWDGEVVITGTVTPTVS